MSFILDALNKSEQERKRRLTAPNLDVHHHPRPPGQSSRLLTWSITVAAILALNAALAWWWINKPASTTPASVSTAQGQTATRPPAPPAPQSGELITPQDYFGGRFSGQDAANTTMTPEVVPLRQLPPAIRDTLPPFEFYSHIYASDAAFRRINLNGVSLLEGDAMDGGLLVDEITEDGAIFLFSGYRFRVKAFD